MICSLKYWEALWSYAQYNPELQKSKVSIYIDQRKKEMIRKVKVSVLAMQMKDQSQEDEIRDRKDPDQKCCFQLQWWVTVRVNLRKVGESLIRISWWDESKFQAMLFQIPSKRSDSKLHRLEENRNLRETSKKYFHGNRNDPKQNKYICMFVPMYTHIYKHSSFLCLVGCSSF